MELAAVLLHSNLKLRDFLRLHPGVVIPSDSSIDLPIEIYVNRRRKFEARPGLCGRKRAFQVIREWHELTEETH